MKIPVEWLKQYIETNKSTKDIAEAFTALGLMLDSPIITISKEGYETDLLDLEHRMDRSDWLSITGCARDLAAMLNAPFKFPQTHAEKGKEGGGIKVIVECPDVINRFNTRVFKNITVKESPEWLKNRLESYGIPSKNNIVDITNYVMLELGQPMHAQDISKMEAPEIVIRKARNGEKITTLLGELIELDAEAFVLAQNGTPTVIGGIVGGIATAVDENTKEIVLDAGNYDQTSIRKTSRRLKIQNETVLRYDKFLHPELTEIAIQRATQLILELAGGEYYENEDWYPTKFTQKQMNLRLSRIKRVSGINFDIERVKEILIALEYKLLVSDNESLTLEVPYFRTDIEVEDDLVADVLRISNYATIKPEPIIAAPPKEITPKIYKFEEKLRDILVNLGLHEHITSSLVQGDSNNTKQITLENALSSELSALRTSIYETLKPVVSTYQKHKKNEIGLFELGNTYTKQNETFVETRTLQVIYKDNQSAKGISQKIRQLLAGLFNNLGITKYSIEKYENEHFILINNHVVGKIEYDSFSIETEKLLTVENSGSRIVSEMENIMYEDVSITTEITNKLGKVYQYIKSFEAVTSIELVSEYVANKEKTLTFRIQLGKLQSNTTENAKTAKESIIQGILAEFPYIKIKQ